MNSLVHLALDAHGGLGRCGGSSMCQHISGTMGPYGR
jgi:hypothetical protein